MIEAGRPLNVTTMLKVCEAFAVPPGGWWRDVAPAANTA
jgi:hypothetical protein